MSRTVAIVPTGTANLASVQAAFRRLGAEVAIVEDADAVCRAERVVLPGVGAFGAAAMRLQARGLDVAIRERVLADRPTLCVCVGHQLLFAASEESPGVFGLGVVAGTVTRFPQQVRTPQFGWNWVEAADDTLLLDSGWAYFANSYRALTAPGWRIATSDHGGRFIAAMEKGNIIGCQFHPELSGVYGAALLARFLELR